MDESLKRCRLKAALVAENYFADKMTFDELQTELGSSEDDLVAELADLVLHQPKRGGLFGANDTEWGSYMSEINRVIHLLSQ